MDLDMSYSKTWVCFLLRREVSCLVWDSELLWKRVGRQIWEEGGREDIEVRETNKSLVRDHEALDVSSVIFFLEGATIYTPNCLPTHCPT